MSDAAERAVRDLAVQHWYYTVLVLDEDFFYKSSDVS
jgi:hypothetical protein